MQVEGVGVFWLSRPWRRGNDLLRDEQIPRVTAVELMTSMMSLLQRWKLWSDEVLPICSFVVALEHGIFQHSEQALFLRLNVWAYKMCPLFDQFPHQENPNFTLVKSIQVKYDYLFNKEKIKICNVNT